MYLIGITNENSLLNYYINPEKFKSYLENINNSASNKTTIAIAKQENKNEAVENNFVKNELPANNFEKNNAIAISASFTSNQNFENKITNFDAGKNLVEAIPNLFQNKLNVIVYNFVDMLSHARTEMQVIRELADDEKAYRSITLSWFEHSPLLEMIKFIAFKKAKLVITTDHGTVHVKEPTKIVGDKTVNTNLRYKQGRALDYNAKEVFEVKNPADAFLPKQNVSSRFIFAREDKYFVYPNNYNHFVNYYKNTFQHGGISLEEMIIPYITLSAK